MKNLLLRNCWKLVCFLLATTSTLPLPGQTPPVITNQPSSQVLLAGSNATFRVAVSGKAPFTYQWRFNGTNLSNNITTTVQHLELSGNVLVTNSYFGYPSGIAADNFHNLYVADQNKCKVYRMDGN